MDGKELYLQSTVRSRVPMGLTEGLIEMCYPRKGMTHFYKAFASLDRADGVCRLICIWKDIKRKKSMQVHNYLLHFNAAGIKEYCVEDTSGIGLSSWLDSLNCKMIEIELPEAAGLIQDAYAQNVNFKTPFPAGIDDNHFMLQYFGETEHPTNQRLLPDCQDIRMFINIILSALRRLDLSLLYDLSAPDRQRKLGDRINYLQGIDQELSQSTFICTKVVSVLSEGSIFQAEAYIVIATPQEELCKISYEMKIIMADNHFYLLDIRESAREQLHLSHPQNPLNYNVFAMLFKHNDKEGVKNWLNQQANILLAGETDCAEQYKWLVGGSAPWEEYCFSQSISAEFFLTDQELLVYSQKPENLAGINMILADDLLGNLELKAKYYLDNGELLHRICSMDGQGKSNLSTVLKNKRAESYLLVLQSEELYRFMAIVIHEASKMVKLGNKFFYHFISKNDKLLEIYSAENYQWVIVYCDPRGELLDFFKSKFKLSDIILNYELEDYFDLFTPPITDERKWEIFQQLLHINKEAGFMRKMGLVPSVKEAATQYGVVI